MADTERSLSHKFAMYLQREVEKWDEGWAVDCEINRDAQGTGDDYAKQLDLIDKIDSFTTDIHDEHATTVVPDVIVHKRGPGNNLLVIGIKKDTAAAKSIQFDRTHKLRAYVTQLGYQSSPSCCCRWPMWTAKWSGQNGWTDVGRAKPGTVADDGGQEGFSKSTAPAVQAAAELSP